MNSDNLKGLEIERLNTALVDIGQMNRTHVWERIVIKSKNFRCCQQGVIPLNTSWGDEHIGQIGERRFLIFGGVFNDFIDNCFIFNENLSDLSKSYCSKAPTKRLPFKDKFFYQQTFKISDLPDEIVELVAKSESLSAKQKQYSENMIVYTGRKGIHIYDIDRENWIFNSPDQDYKYERIYHQVRQVNDSDEDDDEEIEDSDDYETEMAESSSNENPFIELDGDRFENERDSPEEEEKGGNEEE